MLPMNGDLVGGGVDEKTSLGEVGEVSSGRVSAKVSTLAGCLRGWEDFLKRWGAEASLAVPASLSSAPDSRAHPAWNHIGEVAQGDHGPFGSRRRRIWFCWRAKKT